MVVWRVHFRSQRFKIICNSTSPGENESPIQSIFFLVEILLLSSFQFNLLVQFIYPQIYLIHSRDLCPSWLPVPKNFVQLNTISIWLKIPPKSKRRQKNWRVTEFRRRRRNGAYCVKYGKYYIDSRLRGNYSRFCNSSHNPNCQLLPVQAAGEVRLAIVATVDIRKGKIVTEDSITCVFISKL